MSKRTLIVLVLLALLAATVALAFAGLPVVSPLAWGLLATAAFAALLWAAWRLYRKALWKVGRRLAFSYFLIGIVPIPLALMLLGAASYLAAGFLLGHVYGDAVASVRAGTVTDPNLVALRVAGSRWITCASPVYLARHGRPQTIADLADHALIGSIPPGGTHPRPWLFATEPATPAVNLTRSAPVNSSMSST